jgi:hypothetical protein
MTVTNCNTGKLLVGILALACSAVAVAANTPPASETSTATQWATDMATVAESFARAIGIAARELGVAVNDFLNTPAGVLTAAVILWKVIGADVVTVLTCVPIMAIFTIAFFKVLRGLLVSGYETSQHSLLFGLVKYTRRRPVYFGPYQISGERLFIASLFYVIVVLATLAIML